MFDNKGGDMTGIEMLSIALAAGGLAAGAGGIMMQAKHAQEASAYNAAVAEQQMKAQETKGRIAQENIARKQKQLMATQRAKYGASGVTMEGSPLLVMADSWTEFERDKALARFDADTAMSQASSRAGMHRLQGRQAMQAGVIGAGTSLLTGSYSMGRDQGWWGK